MNYLKYLSIPYKHLGSDSSGCDCYGLVRLFYKQEYNIDLPDLQYELDWYKDNSRFILEEYDKHNFVKTKESKEGNLLVLLERGLPKHLGTILNNEYFLHMTLKGVAVHSYAQGSWADKIFCKLTYRG